MQGIRRSAWRGFAMVLVAVVWPCIATAQWAPTGGHYAGRAAADALKTTPPRSPDWDCQGSTGGHRLLNIDRGTAS